MDQSSGNLTSISIMSYRGAMRHSLAVTSWAELEKPLGETLGFRFLNVI